MNVHKNILQISTNLPKKCNPSCTFLKKVYSKSRN